MAAEPGALPMLVPLCNTRPHNTRLLVSSAGCRQVTRCWSCSGRMENALTMGQHQAKMERWTETQCLAFSIQQKLEKPVWFIFCNMDWDLLCNCLT